MKLFCKIFDETKVTVQERKMKNSEEAALISSSSVSDCIDKYTWVLDTGASSHITNSLDGMFDLRPSDGYVKVGDGKKKIQGIMIQKNGRKENIILMNVFYNPGIYCNLFSLTRAMSDGYTMFCSSKKPILIKKDKVEITFDCILKSGLGMTMGAKIVPKKLEEFNFVSMDFLTAHNILCHQDKSRTKATSSKLRSKIKDDDICKDCLLGIIRERNVNKKVSFKASKFGERFMFDISSICHVSIGGSS